MNTKYIALSLSLIVGCNSKNPGTLDAQTQCRESIGSLSIAVKRYSDEHGSWPNSLKSALSDMGFDRNNILLLQCPGRVNSIADRKASSLAEAYIYIDWSKWYSPSNTPLEYPLIYDRYKGNHDGKGVNIGLVNGERFWDADCAWIEGFSRTNAEYGLSLPE